MWLYKYLTFRAEYSERDVGPQTSIEACVEWPTFFGLRTNILHHFSQFFENFYQAYQHKLEQLPKNNFMKSLGTLGLMLNLIAPIPMVICDAAALVMMLGVLISGWITGVVISLVLGVVAWLFGGCNTRAADFVIRKGFDFTEDSLYYTLSFLGIPAAILSMIGFAISVPLELLTEMSNYSVIAAVYECNKLSLANQANEVPRTNSTPDLENNNRTIQRQTPQAQLHADLQQHARVPPPAQENETVISHANTTGFLPGFTHIVDQATTQPTTAIDATAAAATDSSPPMPQSTLQPT